MQIFQLLFLGCRQIPISHGIQISTISFLGIIKEVQSCLLLQRYQLPFLLGCLHSSQFNLSQPNFLLWTEYIIKQKCMWLESIVSRYNGLGLLVLSADSTRDGITDLDSHARLAAGGSASIQTIAWISSFDWLFAQVMSDWIGYAVPSDARRGLLLPASLAALCEAEVTHLETQLECNVACKRMFQTTWERDRKIKAKSLW